MKNKIISLICLFLGLTFIVLIFATSCSRPTSTENVTPNTMVMLDHTSSYYSIWYHNETKVMYIYSSSGGFAVMLGPDGLPLVYKGYEK